MFISSLSPSFPQVPFLRHTQRFSSSTNIKTTINLMPRGIVKTREPVSKKRAATAKPKAKATTSRKMARSTESANVVYFWHPEGNNGIYSQWYPSPFEHEGVKYATAEMWMMVQKAKLFKDEVLNTPLSRHFKHVLQM